MTLSSSRTPVSDLSSLPISAFQYRQMMALVPQPAAVEVETATEPEVQMTEAEFRARLAAERASAIAETEARLRNEYEKKASLQTARISEAIETFERSRKDYFSNVEMEVVKLALAIAGKILHREAQVDPMLVAAIVQIALGQLKEGSAATLRVRPEERGRWQKHFDSMSLKLSVSVTEDAELQPGDCVLQTEIGTVNFSLDAQLKEVEQGFFDVLSRRPQL
jgi:flagellar assembly protein FliH